MNHNSSTAAAAVALLCLVGAASAATPAAAGDAPGAPPDQGAQIASNGGSGFPACVTCHGAQGEGQAAAGFPRLAGQTAHYLAEQLDAYASGARVNPVMQPIAKAMNDEQRRAVSDFYARMTAAARSSDATGAPSQPAAPELQQQGRSLALVGSESRMVQACANCHGTDGVGQWPAIPALAGQHASYLKAALAEWKDGSRRTDPTGQMPRIAQALTEQQVEAVAAYYAALPAPSLPLEAPNARWTATRTVVSGPVGQQGDRDKTATVKGVGVEQGAPLTGGTQGVGSPPASSSSPR